jgi:NADH-quinone oxidoreductase subunit L
VHAVLERKYFLDELYEQVIVRWIFYRGIAAGMTWIDTYVVDGLYNGVAGGARLGSTGLRLLQTGQVQVYGAIAFLGLVIAGGIALLLTPL